MDDYVVGHDGVEIWVDVYYPADAEEDLPVILIKAPGRASWNDGWMVDTGCDEPLDRDPLGEEGCPNSRYAWVVDHYVPRGYAVAFSDIRGENRSGGCSTDRFDPEQAMDGYHVVEWLAAQEWSNGKVGMYGWHERGETQAGVALLNPPSLKTIVPVAAATNLYERTFYHGVAYELPGPIPGLPLPGVHPESIDKLPEHVGCYDGDGMDAFLDQSGDWNSFWEQRDYRVGADRINASVLTAIGFNDGVVPVTIDGFFNQLNNESRLIIGHWGHGQFPDREDWEFVLHRWFDHHLMGIDTGIMHDLPRVLVEDNKERWRGIESFPPMEADTLTLWPAAQGSLDREPSDDARAVVRDYPRPPVLWGMVPDGDLVLNELVDEPAALVFETGPLQEPLHYTGRPVVHLVAETDAERTRWAAHLVRVDAQGEETLVSRGYFNTRHIDGLDAPGDLAPGQTYDLKLKMFPNDFVFDAGDMLRLVVSNVDPWVQQDTTYASSEVLLGQDGTRLELPLAPEGAQVPVDALRDGLRS